MPKYICDSTQLIDLQKSRTPFWFRTLHGASGWLARAFVYTKKLQHIVDQIECV